MKLEIDIDEDYYKIICKRVEENKPYHSPYEYEVIADGKPIEQEPTTKNLAADIEDAVERLNAIKQLIGYDKDSEIVKATQKSLDMAIKALEQEPVIDKIRAEIIEKYWDCDICKWKIDYKPHYAIRGDINDILQILDKYKVGVEPQESEVSE